MIAVIYDKDNSHHSYRLVNGLRACGKEVAEFHDQPVGNFEYVFVEASFDKDLLLVGNIFLYDVEDDPEHFDPKKAYYSLCDKAIAYVKYNYVVKNIGNLKVIACPLLDYITRGKYLADACHNMPTSFLWDAFFIGGPSYYSLGYEKLPGTNHIETENLNTVPFNIWDPNRKDQRVYHQRLEWIAKIKANNKLTFAGGIWFGDNNNVTKEFQIKQFGKDIKDYESYPVSDNVLYNSLFRSKYGLCPSGFARSSFRLIELMALGKVILNTTGKTYNYLYNPKHFIPIKDGENIDERILELNETFTALECQAQENHNLFYNLTPQTMWKDFLTQ